MIASSKTASLSSGLLARKGQARPAMRPQGFISLAAPSVEDLGWNDMGEDVVSTPTPAEKPEVLRQVEALEQRLSPAPVSPGTIARVQRAVSAKKGKAAFTLRLDADRHLRLRLAAAVSGRSAQQVVTQALDAFLSNQPEVEALARQVGQQTNRG
jgi:hypothetical protein